MKISCAFCKKEIEATRKWQKYCNDECRNKYHLANRMRGSDDSIPTIRCPFCTNSDMKMMEEIRLGTYLCSVCAREFYLLTPLD